MKWRHDGKINAAILEPDQSLRARSRTERCDWSTSWGEIFKISTNSTLLVEAYASCRVGQQREITLLRMLCSVRRSVHLDVDACRSPGTNLISLFAG